MILQVGITYRFPDRSPVSPTERMAGRPRMIHESRIPDPTSGQGAKNPQDASYPSLEIRPQHN